MSSSETDMDTYQWLARSSGRFELLQSMENPKTISQLIEEHNCSMSSMQKRVRDLREKDLVEALNPGDAKGILYKRTDKAERLMSDDWTF